EDYPREELFEISAEELTPIALGVLRLKERKQTRLFLRRDRYGRYMSCLVYLPRDRYTTRVRLRAQGILREALHGVSVDYSATVGDSALARLYVVVRAERGQSVPRVDAVALERKRAAAAAASGSLQQVFEEALTALWQGETEDDGFNALVLMAGLTWREVNLLRACAKYLRQGGMRFSEDYVQRVLRSNAPITRLLI